MTIIYKPTYRPGYELCHPVDRNDFETIRVLLNGIARAATWIPLKMQIIREDEGKKLRESDSPWLSSHILIFRPRAIAALGPMLLKYGELLPTQCADAELSLYNVTRALNALDEEASSVERFGDGRIMFVNRHVFREEVIGENDIFKLPGLRAEPIYVSQRFVDLWHSAGLKGFDFDQVWPA
ncbi:MAG: imm11 family protein [Hyphomicrobiales bacterium]